jgi:hypothetical protein
MMGWMAPLRHLGAKMLAGRRPAANGKPSMGEITTIGVDLAKHVFQVHGVCANNCGVGSYLAFHRDIDPVRVMRTRFADPIRASSLFGLHQRAGHMTASDLCAGASHDLLPSGGHSRAAALRSAD